jgi:phosphatidylinositol glycan class O
MIPRRLSINCAVATLILTWNCRHACDLTTDTMLQGAAPGGPYESSLLVVLSDHGQTMGGDHGGSSADETDAVLVAVNIGRWAQDLETQRGKPQAPVQGAQNQAEWQQQGSGRPQGAGDGAVGSQGGATLKAGRCLSSNNGQQEGQHEGAAGTADPAPSASCSSDTQAPPTAPQGVHSLCDAPVVPQLDLTASLALLMGLPIPFSNVGSVDTSLWRALAVRGSDAGLREGAEGDWENGLLSALAANAWQVGLEGR